MESGKWKMENGRMENEVVMHHDNININIK
jgi:hypothetical protein